MISFQEQKEQQNRGEKEKKSEVDKPTAVVRPFAYHPSTPSRVVSRVPRTLDFDGGLRSFAMNGVVSPRVVAADAAAGGDDEYSDDDLD